MAPLRETYLREVDVPCHDAKVLEASSMLLRFLPRCNRILLRDRRNRCLRRNRYPMLIFLYVACVNKA